ncbi:MAG: hypothetical protein PHY48_11500 [Candidatus Cloacimonetes bacterium]|nr:hypothetical protein [Candidatus Cloacimonadota bacterium]
MKNGTTLINWRLYFQLAAILIYITCSTGCRDSGSKTYKTALSQKAVMGQGEAKQTLPRYIVVKKLELLSNTFILNQHHICTEVTVREDIAFDPKVIGIKFNALASFENAGLKSSCMTLWLKQLSDAFLRATHRQATK